MITTSKTGRLEVNPSNIKDKLIKNDLISFNKLLFETRQGLYPERKSDELYEETISITTDVLFIFMAYQRNLNIKSIIDFESSEFLTNIQFYLSRLGNNNVLNENWNPEIINSLNQMFLYFKRSPEEKYIFKTEILGFLVEDTWEKSKETNKASKNGSSISRRGKGSYYTKSELIDIIIKETIDPLCANKTPNEILELKILDPAVGSGAFLIGALKRLLYNIMEKSKELLTPKAIMELKEKIVSNCFFGVDLNFNALRATIYSLWLEVGKADMSLTLIKENFIEGDSLLSNHWDLESISLDDLNIDALRQANYYIVGRRLEGNFTEDWLTVYKEILNEKGDFLEKVENKNKILLGKHSKAFIWQLEFLKVYSLDAGFDAVVGNPPWNKIKAHKKEFFEHFDVTIKDMQGTTLNKYINEKFLLNPYYTQKWDEHKSHIKSYSNAIHNSPHFIHQTKTIDGNKLGGDRDLYKYFLELSYNLIKPNGYVGFIIPAAFTQSEGTTGLRELLFTQNEIELLITVENRDSIFPIDSRFKYLFLVFSKRNSVNESIKCGFMLNSLEAVKEAFDKNMLLNIPKSLINILSPVYKTFPDLKSKFELNILKKIYENHPLINSKKGWKIQFFRELDMTNDSNLFIHKDLIDKADNKDKYIPLYEGRMVHQFDLTAKKYINGEGRKAQWIDLPWDNKVISPHYYINVDDAFRKFPEYKKARPCYCDIAGQTNERAVETTLIPSDCIAGNKVPTIKIEPNNILNDLIWIAITNSFVFDWLMRLRISTTINYFHWNQMPLPIIDIKSEVAKQLVQCSAKLSLILPSMKHLGHEISHYYSEFDKDFDVEPCTDPVKRQYLRSKIDALVANLYGLTVSELAYILYQFPLIDRKQPPFKGDKSLKDSNKESSYVTRDLILHSFLELNNVSTEIDVVGIYEECQINIEPLTGSIRLINERVKKATQLGAVAYIPG